MSASDDDENKKKESEVENDDKETVIRSTAVVKYSVPKVENFVELQCNTNLNLPPSNWLSDSADSYGLQRVSRGQEGFSSFRMAQMFPEVVANVDVISDAENIKRLLKSPYTNEVISMIVHRVENTLLIDNFDIYDRIIRRTQNNDFKWLAEFILKHLGAKALRDSRSLYVKCRTREALRENNLLSKFRYHSLVQKQNELLHDNNVNQTHSSRSFEYTFLPNPAPDTETPDPETLGHKYNRNVVWTFENIQMLLGTDMPIFGRGTYPCISLRLRDVNKPINILTGIDYWLDNLMSNVPEVFMCYHLNGIVQKYELIKTEDIPRLKNSKFSPLVIKDVAQNILSFLKTNATKAGHTYWLFKGKDEEIIKLYDLTCLVPQDEKLQNPFTIPVAMLLYRVARSFMRSNEKKPSGTVKKLLTNCLKLLEEQKYPEIVTSSHFMMSEIYVPLDTNPEKPVFEQESCDNDLVYEADDEMLSADGAESAINYLDLEAQKTSTFVNKSAPPITGTTEERCIQAIHHISKGLSCLKFFTEETKNVLQEDQVPMAKPNEPIPMGYSKLSGKKKGKKGRKNKDRKKKTEEAQVENKVLVDEENALLIKSSQEAQHLPKWKERHGKKDGMSWKDHLKILLCEKLLLVYATLAERYYISSQYGSSLRCIGILAKSSVILNDLGIPNQLRENCLLGRAGDCLFMIANNWDKAETYRSQLKSYTDGDNEILKQLESDEVFYKDQTDRYDNIKCAIIEDIGLSTDSQFQILTQSAQCYEQAMEVSETNSIIQRLACCLNDMGKYYLNYSKLFDKKFMCETVYKAETHFERALELFEKINDKGNIALVCLNMGTMHRMFVNADSPDKIHVTQKNKAILYKAISLYKKAYAIIDVDTVEPKIWHSVNWELSTALYHMAEILDDFPSPKWDEVTAKNTFSLP
ncbi:hypothetical protein WA026_011517 [Henosepilachna vigintioctopunctata]|uniref:Erythroid differentiation-related factor 1 n=1 Tax=Henosepilachna vigintioctopunctata TaxID=420089 RepID=A0AAW1TJP6_9CUCU